MARKSNQSRLEERFALELAAVGLSAEREFVFCKGRAFRLDFAFPDIQLAVEIDGGTFVPMSGHGFGLGYAKDCEKTALLTLLGWRLLRFDSKMLRDGRAIDVTIAMVSALRCGASSVNVETSVDLVARREQRVAPKAKRGAMPW